MTLRSFLRSAAVAVCVSLVAVASLVQPAQAASSVTVTSSLGTGRVSAEGGTTISVTGRGFQSIQNGFGGVYVFFGWVNDPAGGGWKPSRGGRAGADMLYVPDSEARDNQGYQRFVTFPGSSTAATANGGEVSADGGFSFQMVVPGPRFTAVDRDGNSAEIDCTQVSCGVITVGAHGVVNANNETFTPVQFVGADASSGQSQGSGQAPAQQPATNQQAGGSGTPARPDSGQAAGNAGDDAATAEGGQAVDGLGDGALPAAQPLMVPDQPATLGLSQQAVQAGRVLGFTGQNFVPGEQVVATLGSGEAGAGPLTAGRFGEVAGAVTLPMGMRSGTHVLKLVGAGSGQVAEAEVSVMADPASLDNPAGVDDEAGDAWDWAWIAVFAAAAFLLVLLVFTLVSAVLKRRASRRKPGMKRVRVRKGTQPPTGGASAPGADETQTMDAVR